jgi:hypothetical protein
MVRLALHNHWRDSRDSLQFAVQHYPPHHWLDALGQYHWTRHSPFWIVFDRAGDTPLETVTTNTEEIDKSGTMPPPDFSIVDHCLAQPNTKLCTVDTLPLVQVVVVVLNTIKLACLLVLLLKVTEQRLITLGDAITSFSLIRTPSPQMKGPLALFEQRGLPIHRSHFHDGYLPASDIGGFGVPVRCDGGRQVSCMIP